MPSCCRYDVPETYYRVHSRTLIQQACAVVKKVWFDQIVIALGSGRVTLSIDGKPARTNWARGDAEFIGRGVKHEAKNTGGKPLDLILVAIK